MSDMARRRGAAASRSFQHLHTDNTWHSPSPGGGGERRASLPSQATATAPSLTGAQLPATHHGKTATVRPANGDGGVGAVFLSPGLLFPPSSTPSGKGEDAKLSPHPAATAPAPPTPLLSSPLHTVLTASVDAPSVVVELDGVLVDELAHPARSTTTDGVGGAEFAPESAQHECGEEPQVAFTASLSPQASRSSVRSLYQLGVSRTEYAPGGAVLSDTVMTTTSVPWGGARQRTTESDTTEGKGAKLRPSESMRRLSTDRTALLGEHATCEGEAAGGSESSLAQRRGQPSRPRSVRSSHRVTSEGSSNTIPHATPTSGSGNHQGRTSLAAASMSHVNNSGSRGAGSRGVATGVVPGSDHSLTNLFVRNLPQSIDDDQLRKLFGAFGVIISSAIMRNIHTGVSLGTAFVRFETHEQALQALNHFGGGRRRSGSGTSPGTGDNAGGGVMETTDGHNGTAAMAYVGSNGRPLSVQWARKEHDRTPAGEERRRMKKLFVRNIPSQITQSVLEELFAKFGPIRTVSMHRDTVPRLGAALHSPLLVGAAGNVNGTEHGVNGVGHHHHGGVLLEERRIAFVTFAVEGVAEEAAEAVHNTCPFAACDGIPLMVKLAEDMPGRHPAAPAMSHQSGGGHHGASVQNSLNNTLVSVSSEVGGGSVTNGLLNSFNQPPGGGSPFVNTISTTECHLDATSREWCSPAGASLRGVVSSQDFASASLNATQSGVLRATLPDSAEWGRGPDPGRHNPTHPSPPCASSLHATLPHPALPPIPPPPVWMSGRARTTAAPATRDGLDSTHLGYGQGPSELAVHTYPPQRERGFTVTAARRASLSQMTAQPWRVSVPGAASTGRVLNWRHPDSGATPHPTLQRAGVQPNDTLGPAATSYGTELAYGYHTTPPQPTRGFGPPHATDPGVGPERLYSTPHMAIPVGRPTSMLPQPRSSLVARQQQQTTLANQPQQDGPGEGYASGRPLHALWPSSERLAPTQDAAGSGSAMVLSRVPFVNAPVLNGRPETTSSDGVQQEEGSMYAYSRFLRGVESGLEGPARRQGYAGVEETTVSAAGTWPAAGRPHTELPPTTMMLVSPVQPMARTDTVRGELEYYYSVLRDDAQRPTPGHVKGAETGVAALWGNEATDSTYYDLTSSSFFLGGPSPNLTDDTLTLLHTLNLDGGMVNGTQGGTAPPPMSMRGDYDGLTRSQPPPATSHLALSPNGVAMGEAPCQVCAPTGSSGDDGDDDVFTLLNEIERAAAVENATLS